MKAFSTNNMGMDACLGLYDDYYSVYVALSLLEEAPGTGDAGLAAAAVAAALSAAGFASVLRKRRRAA
ncbi:MAG: LPXTG cell wall anchor domain-containing protein [Clostridiales bacterium]|nr:LPXTG cell wall anchor domain-containing protein [Clostridiales bacterium]